MNEYIKKLREKVGNQKLILPGVRAVILNEKGEILLQQRGDFKKWGLPAGSVELNESALDALKREVKEETGLDILKATAIGIYSQPKYSFAYPNGDEVQIFTLAFVVRKFSGNLKIDGKETLALQFFAMDNLPDDVLSIHLETIQDYKVYDGNFILK